MIGTGAFNEMWGRLCSYYDDTAISVRDALDRLQNLKPVKEEDYKGLTQFVDQVESSFTQLATLNQINCLTMRDVDQLCELLPLTKKTEWHRVYHHLECEQQLHPFPTFMTFLYHERKVVSRLVCQQESGGKKRETQSHYTSERNADNGKSMQPKYNFPKCVVHQDEKHTTDECSTFKSMTLDDKYGALRQVHACYRCFRDHRRSQCKRNDPCRICGDCRHNTLLCMRDQVPSGSDRECSGERSQDVSATSSYAAGSDARGIFAIFSVPVVSSSEKAVLFADDGSDCSYIRYEAAKRLGAKKLNKFVLGVTTTGGKETEIESQQYELDLITGSGRTVTVTLFGLSKITGRLSKMDLDVLSKLFPRYDVSLLQRQSTEVDILLGTEYFGLHPKIEVRKAGENLSVMQGSLGVCLQGSHPDLKVENWMHSNSVKMVKAIKVIHSNTNHCVTTINEEVKKGVKPTAPEVEKSAAPEAASISEIKEAHKENKTFKAEKIVVMSVTSLDCNKPREKRKSRRKGSKSGVNGAKNSGGWQLTSRIMEWFHLLLQIFYTFSMQWSTGVAPGLTTDAKCHADEVKLGGEVHGVDCSDGKVRKTRPRYKHSRIVNERLIAYPGSSEQFMYRSDQ